MPKFQLKITHPSIHGVTGHHTVQLQIIETDGNSVIEGISETYGIDSVGLQAKYNGNVHLWLRDASKEMLERHQHRRAAQTELLSLDGETIDL